jgi:hypothetical protein
VTLHLVAYICQILKFDILIYAQKDATLQSLFYLEIALHVSGGNTTHHQERKQLYLQHLVFVRPLLLPAAIEAGSSFRILMMGGVSHETCLALYKYEINFDKQLDLVGFLYELCFLSIYV